MMIDLSNVALQCTIIVDGSHCPVSGAAGYGCWIRDARSGKGHAYSDYVNKPVRNANIAELLGIHFALSKALVNRHVKEGDHVHIRTDSSASIRMFTTRTECPTEYGQIIRATLDLIQFNRLTHSFLHVKGHTRPQDFPTGAHAANRMCDKAAKLEMNRARKLLTDQGNHNGKYN